MWYTSLVTALIIFPVGVCLALSLHICVKTTIKGPWEHNHFLAWQLLQRKSLLEWHTVGNAELISSVKKRQYFRVWDRSISADGGETTSSNEINPENLRIQSSLPLWSLSPYPYLRLQDHILCQLLTSFKSLKLAEAGTWVFAVIQATLKCRLWKKKVDFGLIFKNLSSVDAGESFLGIS